jgi:nitrogen regulatory protein PII 2
MKEIVAIIRGQNVNAAKDALADAGFPAFFASKVLGRGKRHIGELSGAAAVALVEGEELPRNSIGESLSERNRLIAKRMLTIVADDADVEQIVSILMRTSQSGTPGDGRIFVLPIEESWRIRDQVLTEYAI